MSVPKKRLRFALLAPLALLAAVSPGVARADCASLKSAFEDAVAAKSGPRITAAYDEIADDSSCDFVIAVYQERAMDALIDSAAATSSTADRQAALNWVNQRLGISGNWRNAERLGEYYDKIGDRSHALEAYEVAIGLAKEKPQFKPTDQELKNLALRASAGKIVANNDDEGRKTPIFARSLRNADGSMGGVYALLRAVVVDKLPVPINFVYRTTDITPAGKNAAKELAAALAEQDIHALRLIGHADPRGAAQFNMELSRRRAEAAAEALKAELREGHADYLSTHPMPTILTDGKGATEPFDPSVLNYIPTQEEIWALDRRVEFELVSR